jgi:hypothetical protein
VCIIVVKPKKEIVPLDVLRTCGQHNDHGCGYMYPDEGKLKIRKFMKADQLVSSYESVVAERLGEMETPVVLHFRIATRGGISLENCHPFLVTDSVGMAHNGTLSIGTVVNKTDSEVFARDCLRFMTPEHLDCPSFGRLVGQAIGSNRMAFMGNGGEILIVNKILWEEDHGCFFSNGTYKEPRKKWGSVISPPNLSAYWQERKDNVRQRQLPTSLGRKEVTCYRNGVMLVSITDLCPYCEMRITLKVPKEDPEVRHLECPECSQLVGCPFCGEWYTELGVQLGECLFCENGVEM